MTIKQAIYNWITSASGIIAILANQNGPQPSKPYITYQILSDMREGQAEETFSADEVEPGIYEGQTSAKQSKILTVSIQSFGSDALGVLQTLRNSFNLPSVRKSLRVDDLCFVRVLSGPRDIPVITGTTWQERAAMDVEFRAVDIVAEATDTIDKVELIGSSDVLPNITLDADFVTSEYESLSQDYLTKRYIDDEGVHDTPLIGV